MNCAAKPCGGANLVTESASWQNGSQVKRPEALRGAFIWLGAFYFVYCARPEDWITFLGAIPMAKITGILAFVALLLSFGKTSRRLKNLPREAHYLLALIGILFLSAFLSPVWRGGAFFQTVNFSKVFVAWLLTFVLVTSIKRFRRIIFVQAASVATICAVAIVKGRSVPRLNGVMGGIYSNPNDLAFAIVLCLPFCLAFFVTSRNILLKIIWAFGILVMCAALILTASRAGFINLVISGAVSLWHFGIKGRRLYLVVATVFVMAALLLVSGSRLKERLSVLSGATVDTQVEETAYESFEERKLLTIKALQGILHYPILGVGTQNFVVYSERWKQVHSTYLQIAVEGGIPAFILFVLFLRRGFRNLREVNQIGDLDHDTKAFAGALHASLIGFIVGAFFAPEAYQFFTYFAICYTSVLLAMVKEQQGPETRSPLIRVPSVHDAGVCAATKALSYVR
jgi:O-antigen ligase